jgi:hypothetical protein
MASSAPAFHVDGASGGGPRRNVTDEVIDSALRYPVQAPMIDNLMREIGIEGGSLGRMTEMLRDAKDIAALTRDGKKGAKEKPGKPWRGRPRPLKRSANTDQEAERFAEFRALPLDVAR